MNKRKKRQPDQKKLLTPARQLIGLVMLFFFLGFLLLAAWMRSEGASGWEKALILSVAVPALVYAGVLGIPRVFPGDRLLLSLTNFLCALGVLVLFRLNPDRGISQAFNYFVGVVAMLGCAVVFRFIERWGPLVVLLMGVSVGLLVLPLVYGSAINGAKNWVTLFGFGFQPSELVKITLLVAVCWLLSKRKTIWAIGLTGASLLLLMLQKDLGTALLYYGTVLTALWAATGSTLMLLGGMAGAAGGARRKDMNMNFGFGSVPWLESVSWSGPVLPGTDQFFLVRTGTGIGSRSYFAFLFLLKLMRQPASTISRSFSVMGLQYRLIPVALPSLMT